MGDLVLTIGLDGAETDIFSRREQSADSHPLTRHYKFKKTERKELSM